MKNKELCQKLCNFSDGARSAVKEYEELVPNDFPWSKAKLPFGKFSGSTLGEVPEDYLRWMAVSLFEIKNQDRRIWAIRAMKVLKNKFNYKLNDIIKAKMSIAKLVTTNGNDLVFVSIDGRICYKVSSDLLGTFQLPVVESTWIPSWVPYDYSHLEYGYPLTYLELVSIISNFGDELQPEQALSKSQVAESTDTVSNEDVPEYPTRWIVGTKVAIKKYDINDCRRVGIVVSVDNSKEPTIYSIETDYSSASGSYLEEELTDVFDKTVELKSEVNLEPVNQSSYPLVIIVGLLTIFHCMAYYFIKYKV